MRGKGSEHAGVAQGLRHRHLGRLLNVEVAEAHRDAEGPTQTARTLLLSLLSRERGDDAAGDPGIPGQWGGQQARLVGPMHPQHVPRPDHRRRGEADGLTDLSIRQWGWRS